MVAHLAALAGQVVEVGALAALDLVEGDLGFRGLDLHRFLLLDHFLLLLHSEDAGYQLGLDLDVFVLSGFNLEQILDFTVSNVGEVYGEVSIANDDPEIMSQLLECYEKFFLGLASDGVDSGHLFGLFWGLIVVLGPIVDE